jgi:brefeldin A-resistance guanine nucleotide exchange factor 1
LHALILSVLPIYLTPPPTSVGPSTPLQVALAHITSALSQCRFPSSSPQQDELVLLRLLRVIEALATPLPYPNQYPSASGTASMLEQMGDESVCELLEVGLGMLARARLSEGLRNTAQSCVQVIVRACFTRLKHQTPEGVEKLLKAGREAEVKAKDKLETPEEPEKRPIVADTGTDANVDGPALNGLPSEGTRASLSEDIDDTPPPFTPYGLPTILELLRVLIALLNPSDQAHTDSMRLAALAILNTALEVGGSSLGDWPELCEGVRDEGCRYLFQVGVTRILSTLVCADPYSSPGLIRPCCWPSRSAPHPRSSPRCCLTSSSSSSSSSRT